MRENRKGAPFKCKLPNLSKNSKQPSFLELAAMAPAPSQPKKPCHDPFFYIGKGQKSKIAPCLPAGKGLPSTLASIRSCIILDSLKSLKKHRSLERIIEVPKAVFKPYKARRIALQKLVPIEERPWSFRLPTPAFRQMGRGVNSAEEYFIEAPLETKRSPKPLLALPTQYGGGTFSIIKR